MKTSSKNNFKSEKMHILNEYQKSLNEGKIDSKVISILEIINSYPNFYSTSSCSGRILLLALAYPGAKTESERLGSWHVELTMATLKETISKWDKYRYLYFCAH